MKLKNILKYALSETYTILGVLSTFLAVICLVDFNELFPQLGIRALCVLAIFGVSYLAALVKVLLANRATVNLENNREAVLEFGDLFECEDQIVIPVNDSFDTLVNDIVIAKTSIHGQFVLKYFGGQEGELDRIITEQLTRAGVCPVGEYNSGEKGGKLKFYPPGTTVPVTVAGKTFYLMAMTHFKGNRVQPDMKMYYTAVLSMLEYLDGCAAGRPVYMPFLGNGLAGIMREKENELVNLLSVLKMSQMRIKNIHIVLHSDMRWRMDLSHIR